MNLAAGRRCSRIACSPSLAVLWWGYGYKLWLSSAALTEQINNLLLLAAGNVRYIQSMERPGNLGGGF
jgi:hypothetical protein